MRAWRRLLGYFLLFVSTLAWIALPVIPFLSMSTTEKASAAGFLFIFAEITWWLGVPLLGKELIEGARKLWSKLKAVFAK